ncbi:unnamed protein product [Ambrosiozyma monospora]|uniref:Unnamed protein product n=1 Tax=Ambrosiozyma monospora TaxID=43982 RepID=A0ACB5U7E7_AMBMO|nr:unnamed protein product [Ambrosiozyma monospora]
MCAALSRVWTLTPCFRAEESDTNRHLSEFWMLEAEIAFIDHVDQLTKFSEMMIKHVVSKLVRDVDSFGTDLLESVLSKEQVQQIRQRWDMLLAKEWDSITYTKAIEILKDAHAKDNTIFKYEPVWGEGLRSEHEKWLAGSYFKNPVFVTDYPIDEKAFYMSINSDESTPTKTVACFDLLVPDIGELIGGSMREHDLKKLEAEIQRRGMNLESFDWYLALRENGSVPHGGFGMGFERLLQYLSCTDNIRDVIPFPRSVNNCPC